MLIERVDLDTSTIKEKLFNVTQVYFKYQIELTYSHDGLLICHIDNVSLTFIYVLYAMYWKLIQFTQPLTMH